MIDELDPETLALAAALQKIGSIEPSPARVARIRSALMSSAMDAPVATQLRQSTWNRPAMALAFAVMLLVIGTTSVFAAPSALPGSPLYAVRTLKENLEVRLAASPAERAGLYATFATERSAQLRALTRTSSASPEVVNALLRDIKGQIQEANQEANNDGQGARNAVQQAEGQIGTQLNQIQQDGTLPAAQENSLSDTLLQVQAGPSGQSGQSHQSGDSSGNDGNQP